MTNTTDTIPLDTSVSTESNSDFASIRRSLTTYTKDKKKLTKAENTYNARIASNEGHFKAARAAIEAGLHGLADDQNKIAAVQKDVGVTVMDERRATATKPLEALRNHREKTAKVPNPMRAVKRAELKRRLGVKWRSNKNRLAVLIAAFLGLLLSVFVLYPTWVSWSTAWKGDHPGAWGWFILVPLTMLFFALLAYAIITIPDAKKEKERATSASSTAHTSSDTHSA